MKRPSTSTVERQILDALSRHSLSARELQRLVGVSQPTVSRAIGRLGASVRRFGAARATLTNERWWKAGLETLSLGALVAAAAYGASALIVRLIS